MRRIVAAFLASFCAVVAVADDGALDPSFGDGGVSSVDLDAQYAPDDSLIDMATAPDGRIVAIAQSTSIPFHLPVRFEPAIARLTANGALDKTFAIGGRLLLRRSLVSAGVLPSGSSGIAASVDAVAVQGDGRIVIAGYASTALVSGMLIARLAVDGRLDPTFGDDGVVIVSFGAQVSGSAYAVAIAPDGRIVVAGVARPANGNGDIAVARVLADGAPDTSFDGDGRATIAFDLGAAAGRVDDVGRALALQGDGRIVVAGDAQTATDVDSVVVRFGANGAPDPSFGNLATGKSRLWYATEHDDFARDVAISELPTRRIVVTGYTDTAGGDLDMAVAVLDDGGVADVGFSGDGRTTVPFDLGGSNHDIASRVKIVTKVQNIGGFPVITRRIVVAGRASVDGSPYQAFALTRLNFDGSLDATFGTGGRRTLPWDLDGDGSNDGGTAVALDGQGALAIVGGHAMVGHANGSVDLALVFGRVGVVP